jgi:hypothetical protein
VTTTGFSRRALLHEIVTSSSFAALSLNTPNIDNWTLSDIYVDSNCGVEKSDV